MVDIICVFVILFVFFLGLCFAIYIAEKASEKEQDDGEPIKGIENMKIHCSVVSEDGDFYWNTGLSCCVCAYREECKKYIKRYGKLPNGRKK